MRNLTTAAAVLILAAAVAMPDAGFAFPGSGGGKAPAGDAAQAAPESSVDPSAPVVVVNGEPVTKAEFDRAMQEYMQRFQQMSGGMHGGVQQVNPQMKSDILDQLVGRELLYQESTKHPVENMEEKVGEEIAKIKERFPNEEAFASALKAQSMDEEELRRQVRRQLSVRHYVESQVLPEIEVSDEQVNAFYEENAEKFVTPEQVQASHILVKVDPNASDDDKAAAKTKAQGYQERAVAGEDFADLAKEYSDDPGSAARGGDLGFFTADRMVKPFADAAFAMQVGQVSDVVESQFGYHVIKVFDRQEAGKRELADVKEQIAQYLQSQALDQALRAKVEELKKDAKVEVVEQHM